MSVVSGSVCLSCATCALRTTVSNGRRTKSSVRVVVKAASDHKDGVSSGVRPNWRRRNNGAAAENTLGIEWYSAVGVQRLDGATKEGSRFRFETRPRLPSEMGVTISFVRTRSSGASSRPVRQLARPMTKSEPIGFGESLRSMPLNPTPPDKFRPGPSPP